MYYDDNDDKMSIVQTILLDQPINKCKGHCSVWLMILLLWSVMCLPTKSISI